jgi:hypothetical protein
VDSVFPIKKEGRVKIHAPIYQNLEYHAWKAKEIDLKEKSNTSLRINFGDSTLADEVWKRDTPRRNVSDSNVSTPKLLREIRDYLSSDTSIHSKFQPIETPSKAPQEHGSSNFPVSTELPPDSFGSYIDAYKGDDYKEPLVHKPVQQKLIPPAPGMNYYPPYYQPNIQLGMYPNTYVPVYIPIMMQPQVYTSYTNQTLSGDSLTGRIKFFDNTQNYGFFVLDCDGSDLFVHYDDFLKSGITRDYIQMAKVMNTRFVFKRVSYYGKYNLSSKAVDIQMLQGDGAVC